MPTSRFEIKGYNRVRNNLRRLASDLAVELDSEIVAWGKETSKALRLTKYPPKRPGQRYVRTGRLGRSWRMWHRSPGQISIMNNARAPGGPRYASYVVGDRRGKGQAWMHRGRWWTARNVIQARVKGLTQRLTVEIESIWEG